MRKIVFITSILFMLVVGNVFALKMIPAGGYTLITGTVYAHNIYPGNEVPFAHVDITCNSASASINANNEGDFAVGFDRSLCKPGDTVSIDASSPDGSLTGELTTSCSTGSNCKDVVCDVTNASPVLNDPEVPEFSGVAAGLSLAGAAAGFIILRRKK